MANLSDRLPGNAPGKYYVDSSCIDCDQCRVIAPEIFVRSDDGTTFVKRQPAPEEISTVEEAIASCATSSIGDDGA